MFAVELWKYVIRGVIEIFQVEQIIVFPVFINLRFNRWFVFIWDVIFWIEWRVMCDLRWLFMNFWAWIII